MDLALRSGYVTLKYQYSAKIEVVRLMEVQWYWKLGKSCSGNVMVSGTEKQKDHGKQLSSVLIYLLIFSSKQYHAG